MWTKAHAYGLWCSGDVVRVTGTLATGRISIKHSKCIPRQTIMYVNLWNIVNSPFLFLHMLRRDVRPQVMFRWSASAWNGTESLWIYVSSIQIWPKTPLLTYMCSTMMNIMVELCRGTEQITDLPGPLVRNIYQVMTSWARVKCYMYIIELYIVLCGKFSRSNT